MCKNLKRGRPPAANPRVRRSLLTALTLLAASALGLALSRRQTGAEPTGARIWP